MKTVFSLSLSTSLACSAAADPWSYAVVVALFPLWLYPETAYVGIGTKAAVYTPSILEYLPAEILY